MNKKTKHIRITLIAIFLSLGFVFFEVCQGEDSVRPQRPKPARREISKLPDRPKRIKAPRPMPRMYSREEDYRRSEIERMRSDFPLSIEIIGESGIPAEGAISVIKREDCTIKLSSQKAILAGNIYFYLDNSFMFKKERVNLPYKFRWSFRGLSEGLHRIYIIVKPNTGKTGVFKKWVLVSSRK